MSCIRANTEDQPCRKGSRTRSSSSPARSSGLGEAAARRLAQNGAKLTLGARRLDRLQALAKELKTHGRIDVIVNNAGLMPHSPLERLKIDEWDRMIDVNIKGVLYGIAAALPHMKTQKSGHIINVSSVAGHKVRAGGTVYSATKTAVQGDLGGAEAGGQAL